MDIISSGKSSSVKVGAQFSAPNNVTITNSSSNLSTGERLLARFPASSHQLESSFSILALRQAEFLQKWKEITQSGNKDYKDQLEKHWGVSVGDGFSELCTYLGGVSSSIDINEVVNTNLFFVFI